MPEPRLFHRLKDRKVVQWTIGYLTIAWLFLEAFDLVAEQFQWAYWIRRSATVCLFFGLLITVVIAWNHGEKGRQRVTGGEALSLALLLAMAGASIAYLRSQSSLETVEGAAAGPYSFLRDTPPERSVAVLPCADMSSGEAGSYFGEGLAEELTSRLAGIRDLRVAARTSAFTFKDSNQSISAIASALNVRNVLECSVRREGNRVRIAAQLVDAQDGFQRWGESFDLDVGSILQVQGEIAVAIAESLEAELGGGERSRLASLGTESQEAYDHYLRGISLQWKQPWSAEGQIRALEHFQQAVAADSAFAAAWALLAVSYVVMGNFGVWIPEEAYPQAEEAANRAVALDEDLAYGHWALGWVKFSYQFDWEGAEGEFRRTIALAPSDFTGYHSLNFALSVSGRFEEAMAAAREAIALDPLALWPRSGLFELRYKMGDFAGIIEDERVSLDLEPNDPQSLIELALALAHTGASAEAVGTAERAEALAPGDPLLSALAANIFAIGGDREAAQRRLQALEASASERTVHVSLGALAMVYASLGETDMAFELLDQAVKARDSIAFSLHYPEFRPYRQDPRFVALLNRLGLPREAYP